MERANETRANDRAMPSRRAHGLALAASLLALATCDEEEERRPPALGMTTGSVPGAQGGTNQSGSASDTSGSASDSDGTGGDPGITSNDSNSGGVTSSTDPTLTTDQTISTSDPTLSSTDPTLTTDPTISTSDPTLTTASASGTSGSPAGDTAGPDFQASAAHTWAVGARGELLSIDRTSIGSHDAGSTDDLLAIESDGRTIAWVVGTRGLALYTLDGGESWDRAAVPTTAALRAIALVGSERVHLAGDDGQWFVSRDGGVRFGVLQTPRVPWTGLATDALGLVVLATGSDGSVWGYDPERGELARRVAGLAPLRGIASTSTGDRVVAVGDAGTWLESHDYGETWIEHDAGTPRDLLAVRVSSYDELAIAVGDGGVIVRVDARAWSVQELLGDETALRTIDLSQHDQAIVAGDAGLAFTSRDGGRSWQPMGIPITQDLHGLARMNGG